MKINVLDFKPKLTKDREAELLANAVFSGSKHLFDLKQLKFTRYYSKETKNKIKLSTNQLLKREGLFEQFDEAKGSTAGEILAVFYDFMEEVVKVKIENWERVTAVLEAYRKNPKAIEGICKKILTNSNPEL